MTVLSTKGQTIVSGNGIANVDNKRVLTSEKRGALHAVYKKLQQEQQFSAKL